MSDDLADVLRAADGAYFDAPKGMDHGEWLAKCARSYLLSEERVEAAAKAISGSPFPSSRSIAKARAALTAAMGGENGR